MCYNVEKRGNAMNIYYEVHGNSYPIILLHGNRENRKIYGQLVKDPENGYQLIIMDSRYHGKSIKGGPLTPRSYGSGDVMDVANELDLGLMMSLVLVMVRILHSHP